MSKAEEQIREMRSQLHEGHKVYEYWKDGSMHHFVFPALEYDDYIISVPDGPEVRKFLSSPEYQDNQMKAVVVGVALLDIVSFSSLPDETQLKLIVRYQQKVREGVNGYSVARMLPIGDGTIFVFEGNQISSMIECLYSVTHAIDGYNLDWSGDDVPEIAYRIGIHVGHAFRAKDINRDHNYVGTGMNMAQRVSTCVPDRNASGLPFFLNSPIYASEEARIELEKRGMPERIAFTDAGHHEVKHGVYIHVHAVNKGSLDASIAE